MRVFINPGHAPNGNPDSGATNPRMGLRECDIALNIAGLVENYLAAAGCETRVFQNDSLAKIYNTSNAWNADIFVSIHCNAFNEIAHGTETYSYYNSIEGAKLAQCIHKQITESIPELTNRGTKTAGFDVIHYTDCPAVLVETAFIDNDDDAQLLIDRTDDFARAIARGVTDYELL